MPAMARAMVELRWSGRGVRLMAEDKKTEGTAPEPPAPKPPADETDG